MAKLLMKGNEALGEAAIKAGCLNYFCYPITPQTEVAEYLARRMPEVGGVFVQAESELAASNMIFGAAGAGERVFTSSSSPGISLMSEAISYIAGAELPCVFINIMRGGPGLGGILPSQADYYQATYGWGHGDFKVIVLAPSTVQEAVDLMTLAFDLADQYRNPVLIAGDGILGQMMEPVEFKSEAEKKKDLPEKDWASTGCKGREPNIVKSLFLDPNKLEEHNFKLRKKYDEIEKNEQRFDTYNFEEAADVMITSFGTMARICKSAIDELKSEGINVGMFRPITLYPFPYQAVYDYAQKVKHVLSVEMNMGQMVTDIKLAVEGTKPVSFYGRTGGIVPTPEEVYSEIKKILGK